MCLRIYFASIKGSVWFPYVLKHWRSLIVQYPLGYPSQPADQLSNFGSWLLTRTIMFLHGKFNIRVQWFGLFHILTYNLRAQGFGNWQKKFQLHPWLAKIFGKYQKLCFFGIVSKFNFRSSVWRIFTLFLACFIFGIFNTGTKI